MYQQSPLPAHHLIRIENNVVRLNLDAISSYDRLELITDGRIQQVIYFSPLPNGRKSTIKLTLKQLTLLRKRFLEYVEIEKGLKPSTIRGFQSRTRLFIQWLEKNNISIISTEHWREYYAHLKKSNLTDTTVRNYLLDLNGFASWLVEQEHLSLNPLASITPPSVVKKNVQSKAIPQEDIDTMLKHAQNIRDRAIFVFFRDTACRGSEAAAMQWENINLEKGKAFVTGKRGKARTLRFKPVTAQILKEYRETLKEHQKSGPVWWGQQGALTYSGIYQTFRRTAKRAALHNKSLIRTPGGMPLVGMQPRPVCQQSYSRRCWATNPSLPP